MIQIYVEKFGTLISELDQLIHDLYNDGRSELPQNEQERIKALIDKAADLCKSVELDAALKLIKQINGESKDWWIFGPAPREYGAIMQKLQDIMKDELRECLFMFIPYDDAQWYEMKNGFGDSVSKAFPSAQDDIKESGTCFATGRYTGCVFHSMRVLEHGLRALAKDVKVDCGKKSWGKIIGKIKDVIDNLNPQTESEIQHSKFLSETATEFRYFKDAWRNHVSHLRYTCKDREEALLILNHVKSFMVLLSKKLRE